MQINGKCKIANKWTDGVLDKNAFDFEIKDNHAKGRLTWFDVVKGKNGEKDTFTSTTKNFICFNENIDFINQNLGKFIEIQGALKSETFTNKEGKKITYDKIIINNVSLFIESNKKLDISTNNKSISSELEDLQDDEIPF